MRAEIDGWLQGTSYFGTILAVTVRRKSATCTDWRRCQILRASTGSLIADGVGVAGYSPPLGRTDKDLATFGMGKIHTLRALARNLGCPEDFLPEDEILINRFRKYFRKGRWPSRPALNLRRLLWPAVAGAGLLFALAMIWLLIRGPAPQAKPDTVTTDEDQPLTVSWDELLKNDENVGRKAGQITISVPERTDDGNITISNDAIKREIVLKPTQDFPGKSSFEYELRDKWGRPSPARVTIQVRPVNDPPQAPPVEQATVEDTPLTISSLELRQQAKDVDDDLGQITLVSVGKATHGTVKGPDSVGTVEFIPDANFHGDDASFEYTIRDRAGAKATGTVNIKVAPVNDPPTPLQPVLEIKWDKQPPVRIPIKDLVNNFKDVDDTTDQLTFDGLIEGESSGGTATRVDDDVQFTPTENLDRWFRYRVKDSEGAAGEARVIITVARP